MEARMVSSSHFQDFYLYATRFGDSFAPSYKMSRYRWAEPLVD
ncbi:hypothetical protein LINPERHAP2_LOCUS29136, partial [Linum perenne]